MNIIILVYHYFKYNSTYFLRFTITKHKQLFIDPIIDWSLCFNIPRNAWNRQIIWFLYQHCNFFQLLLRFSRQLSRNTPTIHDIRILIIMDMIMMICGVLIHNRIHVIPIQFSIIMKLSIWLW